MAIFVNTNVSSLHGRRNLNNVQNSLSTTYNRLSSGLRINSAKDDAAGLQIADRLTTQINGLNQGNRNASDAVALAQTIEGGLDEMSNMLQRVRTLAVQAANGTNTQEDRVALSKESKALTDEITRIASQTKFGGKTVLSGIAVSGTSTRPANSNSIFSVGATAGVASATGGIVAGKVSFQVGANSGDKIELTVESFLFCKLICSAGLGSMQGAAAGSGTAGGALGTNSGLATGNVSGLIVGAANSEVSTVATQAHFGLSTQVGAERSIASIDKLIAQIDKQRGVLGTIQNRLDSTIRNQSNVSANQADARARIRDTDFAEESANLTQQNIIQQAASSMLMQANMRPQLALSLLG